MSENEISFSDDLHSPRSPGELWYAHIDAQPERIQKKRKPPDPGEAVAALEEMVNKVIVDG